MNTEVDLIQTGVKGNSEQVDQSRQKALACIPQGFFCPLPSSLSDNQSVSESVRPVVAVESGSLDLWLCGGCQLKVIGHVAFIMLSLGGRGRLFVCVSARTCVCLVGGWGRGVFTTVNSGNAL